MNDSHFTKTIEIIFLNIIQFYFELLIKHCEFIVSIMRVIVFSMCTHTGIIGVQNILTQVFKFRKYKLVNLK
jgi:hypothetical protein